MAPGAPFYVRLPRSQPPPVRVIATPPPAVASVPPPPPPVINASSQPAAPQAARVLAIASQPVATATAQPLAQPLAQPAAAVYLASEKAEGGSGLPHAAVVTSSSAPPAQVVLGAYSKQAPNTSVGSAALGGSGGSAANLLGPEPTAAAWAVAPYKVNARAFLSSPGSPSACCIDGSEL